MTLADQLSTDLSVFFNTDEFAAPVTYNTSDISVIIVGHGTDADANSVFDFVDVIAKASDVPTVTYRTDTLVYDGLTWRYPKVLEQDAYCKKIRLIRNQRPKVR